MYDRTNDDRLRILQERLAQIKQKRENPNLENTQRKEVAEVSDLKVESPREKKEPNWGLEEKKKKSHKIKYFILLICIGLGVYVYTNDIHFTFSGAEEVSKEKTPFVLKYNFEIEGSQLAIINSFKDEHSAKAMVHDLTVKGFKCDYFFLPNKSNSSEEVYKVFIGPYESLEEANQWRKNVNGKVEILTL